MLTVKINNLIEHAILSQSLEEYLFTGATVKVCSFREEPVKLACAAAPFIVFLEHNNVSGMIQKWQLHQNCAKKPQL